MIKDWIAKSVLKDVAKISGEFGKNKPFKHILIEDFLVKKKVEGLSKELKKEEFEPKDSDLFSFNQTQDLHYAKSKKIKEFVKLLERKEFSDFIFSISGISLKPGALDLFGSLYEDTNYLLCHDDQLEDRKIAYILYLNEDFEEKDGGGLVLRDDNNGSPGKVDKRYYPKFNSLVIFEVSKKSWHEVEEVMGKKQRYAIGGWLH